MKTYIRQLTVVAFLLSVVVLTYLALTARDVARDACWPECMR